jgi:hypothetical protein
MNMALSPDNSGSVKPSQTLLDAVRDADILIDYVSTHRTTLDSGAVEDVLKLKSELQRGEPTVGVEIAFWLAINALSNAALPATPRTIRLSNTSSENSTTFVRVFSKAVSRHRLATFIFFILALIFNSYLFIASRTLADIADINTKIDEGTATQRALDTTISALTPIPNHNAEQSKQLADAKAEKTKVAQQLAKLEQRAQSSVYILNKLVPQLSNSPKTAEITLNYITNIISLTILPILMGGLGACVFVVRKISDLVKLSAYEPETSIGFRLRIYLGCIAGLIVAQFGIFTDKTLPPLAFAFLAGYGIDMFFSALDRLVGAFGASTPGTTASTK